MEQTNDTFSPYHCSAEWHLGRMRAAASLIYSWSLKMSKQHEQFYCSTVNMATYFGCSRGTIGRGISDLKKAGFFLTVFEPEPFKTGVYEVLTHKEWASVHPGQCVTKIEFDWSKGDSLGQALYAASGGRVQPKEFQLSLLRKTGLADDEIVSKFKEFLATNQPKGKEWRRAIYQFTQEMQATTC